jgi:tetratricopeptide (TPR) repeat protein
MGPRTAHPAARRHHQPAAVAEPGQTADAGPLLRGDCEAFNNLGVTLYELGRYREAVRRAIRLKSDYAEAYYNLGLIHLATKNRTAAQEQYAMLKTPDPALARGLFNLMHRDKIIDANSGKR